MEISNQKSKTQNLKTKIPMFPNTLQARRVPLTVETRSPAVSEIATEQSESKSLPVLDFIASDETLDRFGEVICASGWRLETYRRNPVFQNAHQYGDILFTLGKALITEVRAGERVECGVRSAECGVGKAECGIGKAESGIGKAESGIGKAESGVGTAN